MSVETVTEDRDEVIERYKEQVEEARKAWGTEGLEKKISELASRISEGFQETYHMPDRHTLVAIKQATTKIAIGLRELTKELDKFEPLYNRKSPEIFSGEELENLDE